MFEKSLLDLIRGLRNHKGNEKEYVQNSLKECRTEIRGKDMDLKATALLKLVYLEMFGHDMSWAAFHVLEVMSSSKYIQKRVGYLGAVQTFRADTEVLMLATNLLKKDLVSPALTTMSLPIITLPHIISPSLAMSVLSDLLPRLTHSSPFIRKKTVVTLYRLALAYPETLRPAWPKIKERLMDENEDSSVTAAIVNVVCELGWRRPQDFLPLAPRLFELLVDSGNNWMAIKLIKLFATLTPLEPRLVKKLLPPLTSIIRTTNAMSLLYECINGIIQGGILGGADDFVGEDEIATLCVSKLRGMIMLEGDPNLKYVALLAFNKIVLTHPHLVAQQEDVILDCIESQDISIRLRALDLVVGMVSSDNLMSIIGRLMRQLRTSPSPTAADQSDHAPSTFENVLPTLDSDDETPEVNIKSTHKGTDQSPPLPDEYRTDVINKILSMCSNNNFSNIVDFDWYIDILTQLIRYAPTPRPATRDSPSADVAEGIGDDLRSVCVKVRAVRSASVRAAESIVMGFYNGSLSHTAAGRGALAPTAWIVGEFAVYLLSPEDMLTALLQIIKSSSNPEALAIYLQSILKLFSVLVGNEHAEWTRERKTMVSLLMARVIDALEPLAMHPDLEVQERAVEFCELLKLTAEACSGKDPSSESDQQEPPLLLTQAIPSLFAGMELNSVALGAQRNVPIPSDLDLDNAINPALSDLLLAADRISYEEMDKDDFEMYYHQNPSTTAATNSEPAISRLVSNDGDTVASYQHGGEETYLDPDIVARRRAERMERNKDDPFYIAGNRSESGLSTPLDNIIRTGNGEDLDIDSIPIMQLDLSKVTAVQENQKYSKSLPSKARPRVQITADETLPASGTTTPRNEESEGSIDHQARIRAAKNKSSLLQVDSSNIGAFSLEGDNSTNSSSIDFERQQHEDAEMAKAILEVEKLRLEMQRANERIQIAQGVPPEGTVVKKKTKKKVKVTLNPEDEVIKPKKKKVKQLEDLGDGVDVTSTVKRKKTKKKPKTEDNVLADDAVGSADLHP